MIPHKHSSEKHQIDPPQQRTKEHARTQRAGSTPDREEKPRKGKGRQQMSRANVASDNAKGGAERGRTPKKRDFSKKSLKKRIILERRRKRGVKLNEIIGPSSSSQATMSVRTDDNITELRRSSECNLRPQKEPPI